MKPLGGISVTELLHFVSTVFNPVDVQFTDALVTSTIVVFRKGPPPHDSMIKLTFGKDLLNSSFERNVYRSVLDTSEKWGTYFEHRVPVARPKYKLGDNVKKRRKMKKALYFSLIMLGATIASRIDAYKVSLYNSSDKPVKFFVHRVAAPQRSRTVQPHSTDSRDIEKYCIKHIDFHIVEPNGKTSKEKVTIKGTEKAGKLRNQRVL